MLHAVVYCYYTGCNTCIISDVIHNMTTPQLRATIDRFITTVERVVKIDVRYLARGTFWSTMSQIASIASILALSMVVSRYLPKEVYGEYKFILSLISILYLFSLSGFGQAVLQSVSRGYDGALAEGFRSNLRWSIGIFVGALALAAYYFLQGNSTIAIGVLIGGCISPWMTSASLASAFLTAKKDFARLAYYGTILGSLVPVAALITTILLTHNVIALVAVYFVSNLITDLYMYRATLRVYQPDPDKRDPGMFTYIKHLSVMGILGGIAANLDQLLLFHFVGPVDLALYNFAIGIPDQLKGPMKNLDGMLQARFANYLPRDIRKNMQTKSLLLLGFAVICIAVYIPLAPYLFHLLFPNYNDAIWYSQLYMLSFLYLAFTPSASYLASKRLITEQYISNASSNIFQIISMTIGVIGWGLAGLICSIIATRMFTGITWYVLYRTASHRDINTV